MQDELFYMTERLNLTVITKPCTFRNQLFENGSWSGGMGLLQRQEADVVSYLLGVNLQRAQYAGQLEWHSAEFSTQHSEVILEWWIGVALRLVECGVQARVEWQSSTPWHLTPHNHSPVHKM